MDLLTDFSSGAEWGLDLLSQPNVLFGDLNDVCHLKGDYDPARKPGDAVDQMACSPDSNGSLDFDWMESGDLSTFLDALDNGQDGLSTQNSLFDCSQEIVLDNLNAGQTKTFSSVPSVQTFNLGLTPPDSPEQVTPVIKLDPEINDQPWGLNTQEIPKTIPSQSYSLSLEEYTSAPESPPVIIQAPVDFLDDQIDLKPEIFGVEIFGLPVVTDSHTSAELTDVNDLSNSYSYSSDDGSNILSPSGSPSPKPSIDSLIQSSPELYKVIATPSARFSPYSKLKGDKKHKGSSKAAKPKVEKDLPELIPEEHFPRNLGKKERKKLQNKNAAIRYRQKKKAEVKCIATEVQDLEDKNQELKTKVDDLQREVRYMKNLMEDIYRAKGLVS